MHSVILIKSKLQNYEIDKNSFAIGLRKIIDINYQ